MIKIKCLKYELKIIKEMFEFNYKKFLQFSWDYGIKGISICLPFVTNKKWIYVTKKFELNCKSTIEHRINPIPYWIGRFKYNYMLLITWLKKEEYKRCQGCGMGISEYKIRDPNQGYGHKWFNCCKGCVNFYDRRWSQMKIIKWKNGISVGQK